MVQKEFRDGGWRENSVMSSRSESCVPSMRLCTIRCHWRCECRKIGVNFRFLKHTAVKTGLICTKKPLVQKNPTRICCSHELVILSSLEYECPCQQTEPCWIVAVCSSVEEEAVNLDVPACQQRLVTEKMDSPEMMDAA